MRKLLAKIGIHLPPLPTSPPTHVPDQTTLLQLAAVIAIALFLHFSIASVPVALFSLAIFGLKCLLVWRKKNVPPQWLIVLLTITSVGLIVMFYGGWNGQTAGISFLVLLVSLKFLESHTIRDYFMVCLILYFLTASSFLFNSSLTNIVLVMAYTIAITGLLFKITNPAPVSTSYALKSSSMLIMKAIPLALFLFFFFPRIQGSFGFLPSLDKNINSLNDSLVAGDIASNAFSNELAFKAEFKDGIPQMAQLYWRSKVMTEEIDFSWAVSKLDHSSIENQLIGKQMREQAKEAKNGFEYQILHEPSRDLFIPYLDYVSSYDKGLLNYDYSVVMRRPERRNFAYSGSSSLLPSFDTGTPRLDTLTATKSQPSARVQALLGDIRREHTTDVDRANALFAFFVNNQFNYSLTPPGLDEFKPLDDFLFNTRTGYCEHYASAFTTLARWLGIPSRIVVGYHGGTVNQTGNFLEVRYSDAHAWSEVYIDNTWLRYDATGAISPERIQYGMGALRELWENDLLGSNNSGLALTDFLNPSGGAKAWRKMRETWSNVQFQWEKWVVDYDFETQQELLQKIGLGAKNSLTTLILTLSGGAFFLLSVYFWHLLPKPQKMAEHQRVYRSFIKKAKKAGVPIALSDTPNQIATKFTHTHPEQRAQIDAITGQYNQLCYGKVDCDIDNKIKQLKHAIRQLKPKRIKPLIHHEKAAQ